MYNASSKPDILHDDQYRLFELWLASVSTSVSMSQNKNGTWTAEMHALALLSRRQNQVLPTAGGEYGSLVTSLMDYIAKKHTDAALLGKAHDDGNIDARHAQVSGRELDDGPCVDGRVLMGPNVDGTVSVNTIDKAVLQESGRSRILQPGRRPLSAKEELLVSLEVRRTGRATLRTDAASLENVPVVGNFPHLNTQYLMDCNEASLGDHGLPVKREAHESFVSFPVKKQAVVVPDDGLVKDLVRCPLPTYLQRVETVRRQSASLSLILALPHVQDHVYLWILHSYKPSAHPSNGHWTGIRTKDIRSILPRSWLTEEACMAMM